jgi:hypothetical protein
MMGGVNADFRQPDPAITFSDQEWLLLLRLRETGHKREAIRLAGVPDKTGEHLIANVAEKLRLLASS